MVEELIENFSFTLCSLIVAILLRVINDLVKAYADREIKREYLVLSEKIFVCTFVIEAAITLISGII